MEDEEDCNCGLDEPKPEIACQLELIDAVKLYNEYQNKQALFEDLKGQSQKTSSGKKKKQIAIQGIQVQRQIQDLEEGMDLAFQRFAKCEQQNPQVQNLNMDAAAQKITNLWKMIANNDISQSTDARQSSRGKKKNHKKQKKKK